jgi:hypothetical protein
MTVDQQLAYWKHYSRQHEATVRAQADYADLKAKADAYDQHRAATATDQEKAVQTAVDAAVQKVQQDMMPRLVRAEFKVATAGRVADDHLDLVLQPLDLRWFLDTAGNVDSVKVATYAQQIAPSSTPPGTPPGTPPLPTPPGTPPGTPPVTPSAWPDLGQGRGAGATPTPSVSRGRELYKSQKKTPPPGAPATS